MMSAARAHPLVAASSILACALLLLSVSARPAAAQGGGGIQRPSKAAPGGLQRLWSAYPVRSKAPASARTARKDLREASASPDRVSSRSSSVSPLLLVLAGLLGAMGGLVLLLWPRPGAVLASARARRRRLRNNSIPQPEGLTMTDLLRRLLNANEGQTRESEAQTTELAGSADLKRTVADSARGPESGDTSTQPEQPGLEARTADVAEPPRAEVADEASLEIGEQVAGILSSAKQAAQQLRESAQQEAEHIRAEAKRQAAETLDRAKKEWALRREDVDKVRTEADAYGKNTRESADRHAAEMRRKIEEEVAKLRSEAQQEAADIRRGARQKADELAAQTLQRQKALIAEAERSEARLHQLVSVYRAMTSQLEDLLGSERAQASGEQTAEGGSAPVRELDEALRPRPIGHPPG